MDFESSPPEADLLGRRIADLGLRLEGTIVERYVARLYEELAAAGLVRFRPVCYLSDEWGCPDREPVIGIPFYLADPRLQAIERERNDLEDEREILMYLRHEAGHAFNYAYRLYRRDDWRALFGRFEKPYRDHYRPQPFSRRFVRHIAGWYAQKHPDEDFAETFAVWLTPGSRWRERYAGWPALDKLRWVDGVAREVGGRDPEVPSGAFDLTVDEMDTTVGDFYRELAAAQDERVELAVEGELADVFPAPPELDGGEAAADLLRTHRLALTNAVATWTGVRRPLVRALIERMVAACRTQGLVVDPARRLEQLVEVSTLATALAMNYLVRGRFEHF